MRKPRPGILNRLGLCLLAAVFAGSAAAQAAPAADVSAGAPAGSAGQAAAGQPVAGQAAASRAAAAAREMLSRFVGAGPEWGSAFAQSYVRALGSAPFEPSGLALRIALAEASRSLAPLPPDRAAALALSCALEVERDMRFGSTPQEARAFLRLYLRVGGTAGGRSFAEAYGRDAVRGGAVSDRSAQWGLAASSPMLRPRSGNRQ